MTLNQLVNKLEEMRAAGKHQQQDVTLMMHLFGIIFANEIARHGGSAIAAEYTKKTGERIGNGAQINDGRKLAQYVADLPGELARWK